MGVGWLLYLKREHYWVKDLNNDIFSKMKFVTNFQHSKVLIPRSSQGITPGSRAKLICSPPCISFRLYGVIPTLYVSVYQDLINDHLWNFSLVRPEYVSSERWQRNNSTTQVGGHRGSSWDQLPLQVLTANQLTAYSSTAKTPPYIRDVDASSSHNAHIILLLHILYFNFIHVLALKA